MNSEGYAKVRACLDESGLRYCVVTNPADQDKVISIADVGICIPTNADPALAMAALRNAGLLRVGSSRTTGYPDPDEPELALQCAVGSYLLFEDMNTH